MNKTAAIQLAGLSRSFGPVTAVDNIDLHIAPGELVALLGPNGAGKSTTTEIILGAQTADRGTVSVFGQSPTAAMRAGRVGAMLQQGTLLAETSVHSLLRLMAGLHQHPLPLDQVIERAGIGDILRARTDKLSGGQAQRVRFALALLPDPDLMLLDEPTVAMDVDGRRSFWARMQSFADTGRTVVFATHYLDEADSYADRVVVMARGRIVADGTGSEIKSRVGERRMSFQPTTQRNWDQLPGVRSAQLEGERVNLVTSNSDQTLRAVLEADPEASAMEITGVRLEDAFVAITQ